MQPSQELIDEIYRERVLRARRMSPEEKFLAGPRLFEYACAVTMAGIRSQHPEADEATVREMLRQRLQLQKCLEEQRIED